MKGEKIIRAPSGPIRPVLEALDDVEIFQGFVASLEDSSEYQRRKLEESGWEFIEEEDRLYHTIYGLDGESWHLPTLFSEYFPELQRASALLVCWAIFERHLDELCREVANTLNLKLGLSDLNGTGIRRVRTYLTKVAGFTGEWAESLLWQEVVDLQSVRNLFAHGDGTLGDNHRQQRDYASRSPHVTLVEDRVTLGASFPVHVLEVQDRFLQSLKKTIESQFGEWSAVIYEVNS